MIRFLQRSTARHLSTIHKPMVDYKQRGQFRAPLNLKIGDQVNGFSVTQQCKLPDFEIESAVLRCRTYGTEWVHLDCEEQRNTIAFVVKCRDVPHTVKLGLQKMLQCGSKKYPIRNPIEHMTRRSFNPLNLSTSTPDYISYQYQTLVPQDHSNLMDVFLNMLFDPLMRQEDFKETVWRYALRDGRILQVEGETVEEVKASVGLREMKVFDVIERELFGGKGLGELREVEGVGFQGFLEWYRKVFDPRNLLIVSHGDLHPAKLIQKYREITKSFNWQEKYPSSSKKDNPQPKKAHQIEQSKTIKIQHLQTSIPLILSFRLDNLTLQSRILLSILSYILFDTPDSPMMRWNTPNTPYPRHYGFQGNCFNIGITLERGKGEKGQNGEKEFSDKELIQIQKEIRTCLEQLCSKKISDYHIQQCLLHLQSEYYSDDGVKIINGCLDNLIDLGTQSLQGSLNVKSFITRTLRSYRKDNIFENLLKTHILQNKKYIRIWGKTNPNLLEDLHLNQSIRLSLKLQTLTPEHLHQLSLYRSPNLLQDYTLLPQIPLNTFQIFQQKSPTHFTINNIPIHHVHKCNGIKLTIKYDVTDLQEEDIKLVPIVCEAFPWMGGMGITPEAYRGYFQMYVRGVRMWFGTERARDRDREGMRMFLFLEIQFSDRNAQYGFNLFSNLINDHNHNNLEVLSQTIQKKASQTYNDLTQNLAEIHGRHIGGTRSPYSLMEDPIFMARATCGLASEIRKISNPTRIVGQLAGDMRRVTEKFNNAGRMEVLFQCKSAYLKKYHRYLQAMLNPIKSSPVVLTPINTKTFTPTPILKYFPNYHQQFIFQAFTAPYSHNPSDLPATLVLSSIINQNIKRYNTNGGCFLFKGALISFLRGSRKKVLELEDYYRRVEDVEEAKRVVFQQFRRYTARDAFYTGVTAEEARVFKQAVAMADQKSIEACLEKYILATLKEGKSSILALGPHLGNYEPLIKKGWVIQRSIDDLSLQMESQSIASPQIETSKYINIY